MNEGDDASLSYALKEGDGFAEQMMHLVVVLCGLYNIEGLSGKLSMQFNRTPVKNNPTAANFHDFSTPEMEQMIAVVSQLREIVATNCIAFVGDRLQAPSLADMQFPPVGKTIEDPPEQVLQTYLGHKPTLQNVRRFVRNFMPVEGADPDKTCRQFLARFDVLCQHLRGGPEPYLSGGM